MTSASQILHHTTVFISKTISQSDRRHLFLSTLRRSVQPSDQASLKTLNLAVESLENAISSTSSPTRSSSLRLAERLVLSQPENPFSSFLLSLIYSLLDEPVDAALCVLHVFRSDPSLARSEIASDLFDELFLVHLLPVLHWLNEQRTTILSSSTSNLDQSYEFSVSDESVVLPCTKLLSRMSDGQASELKELESNYEQALDENCRILAKYFQESLKVTDGNTLINLPPLTFKNYEKVDKIKFSEDEKAKTKEPGPENERYNVKFRLGQASTFLYRFDQCTESSQKLKIMIQAVIIDETLVLWTQDTSLMSSQNVCTQPIWAEFYSSSGNSKPKSPPLYPLRVSAEIFTNQSSSRRLEVPPSPTLDFELESLSDENSAYSSSSSESEVEIEEEAKKLALFEASQNSTQKQKQPISAESSSGVQDSVMADFDNLPNIGKHTPPKDFVCPITSNIFDDPVTLETGQTYERKAIQEWLDRGNSTCPITRQKLQSNQLPKTNYVLKRLIASWQERNPITVPNQLSNPPPDAESIIKPVMPSASPISVISQAIIDGTISELRIAITNLCMSEVLEDSESAVLQIERFWQDINVDIDIRTMLSRPPVINGFVEILFSSVDPRVLKATIFLLSEMGSKDNDVIQTLTRVDTDVKCIVALFKKGLMEAVVLIYLLKPSADSLEEVDFVDSLLKVVKKKEEDLTKMCLKPKTAAVILLGQILRSSKEISGSSITHELISEKVIERIVGCLEAESTEEKIAAVGILLRCMKEDGKCRNTIADKAELGPVLESFMGASDAERFEIVHFLSELIKLNRRTLNENVLHIIKDEGAFNTMHALLVYLQTALPEQRPAVAGLLLQLDLLEEPRKMSIYREEAIDTLISCLRNSEYPTAQTAAAETIVSLQGRFSASGKPLTRAFLLKRAGLERSYQILMRMEQLTSTSGDSEETEVEEKAADNWERKIASVLASHEFGLLFEALAEGLMSRFAELCSACFVSAVWLIHMLKVLPDTGISGAARTCLLKRFISIFKSAKDVEDKGLSLLVLNTFIHDPEGLHDLTPNMKEILKGLRELKKSSTLAFEMLKICSKGSDASSQDFWSHKELIQVDCSKNGEVLSIACFKGKIFSGHSDGTIKVWTGRGSILHLIHEVREHTKAVTSLAILRSGERLYSGSLDKTTRVWSVNNEVIDCVQVHDMKDQVHKQAVSNSIACYIPQGSGVKVYSWNGGTESLNSSKYVKCLALVRSKLYCGCQDNSIQEIDLATGTVSTIQSGSRKLLGKANPINALQVHSGLIYSASSPLDGSPVKIWSTSDYSLVGSLPTMLDVRAIAISPELIYLGSKGGTVEIWDKEKKNRVEIVQTCTNGKVNCMAFDGDEEFLVIGTSDGHIQAWGLKYK